MDGEPAALLLNQLQPQRDLAQSQSTSVNPPQQASAFTGLLRTSENKQGQSSSDESQIIGDDCIRDGGVRLENGWLIQRTARNEVVDNCSNISPKASRTTSKNYYADPQNFSHIDNDQVSVDSRSEIAVQRQARMVQNDPGIELDNENSQDAQLHSEQFKSISGQVESISWNIELDMDVLEILDGNPNMDVCEGSNNNHDIYPGVNIDWNTDLFNSNIDGNLAIEDYLLIFPKV